MIKNHPQGQNKPELAIRPANRMDAPLLAAMALALAEEEGRQGRATPDAILLAMREERIYFLIAEWERQPCGMLMYYAGYDLESASHGAHLADLYVMPQARRQGVASRLVAALAAHVRGEGGAWVSLTVLEANEAGRKLYETLGIHQVSVHFMAVGGSGLDAMLQRRNIA